MAVAGAGVAEQSWGIAASAEDQGLGPAANSASQRTEETAARPPAPGNAPRFSVIMPVYNHVAYVGRAIGSVLAQTWRDFELIVVDDGSTDKSGEIIDAYAAGDDRVVAVHQPNSGQGAARNAGIKRARAEWLAYLDSDDVWFADTLANYAAYIADHPDAKFIYGFRHRLNPDGSVAELPGHFQDQPTGLAEVFENAYLSPMRVCHRRELLRTVGLYDTRRWSCDDYHMYLRMAMHYWLEPMGKATGLRRRHGSNLSRDTGETREGEAEMLREFAELPAVAEWLGPHRVARRLGKAYYAAGRQYFKAARFREAISSFAEAHRYRRTLKSSVLMGLAKSLAVLTGTLNRTVRME
jgi:glycosyltransferase involved in cell wall biosynthesis